MKDQRIKISAAKHHYNQCPVSCPIVPPKADLVPTLHDEQSGARVPAQLVPTAHEAQARVVWIVDNLPPAEERRYTLSWQEPDAPDQPQRVRLESAGPHEVSILLDGAPFSTYHSGPDFYRPFLHPLIGPSGKSMVRGFPLTSDVPDDPTDHVHHKGMWTAHGDVNGADHWSEEKGACRMREVSLDFTPGGPVCGQIVSINEWLDAAGKPILRDHRTHTIYAASDTLRLIDYSVRLEALGSPVKMGDTKEGGILALRVAANMQGDRTGTLHNSEGGIGEAAVWGKRAAWCDYHGTLGGEPAGVAILEHPSSFRHPTWWHARDYGLFATNPFGWSDFYGDPSKNGGHTIPAGEEIAWKFRVILHKGDTVTADIAARYADFVGPPRVEVLA